MPDPSLDRTASDQIEALMKTAIEPRSGELEHQQDRRWLTPTLVGLLVLLAACSKSEPPPQAKTAPPALIVAPAPSPAPPPEPVATQSAAPVPAVQQHIPGSPDAKAFVAANVVKQPKKRAPTRVVVPDTAYEKAYRNAARADKLLQRHAYVTGFDDVAATNAIPLSREYR
jgi:hypothetical protein